jgi:hypothetical protein
LIVKFQGKGRIGISALGSPLETGRDVFINHAYLSHKQITKTYADEHTPPPPFKRGIALAGLLLVPALAGIITCKCVIVHKGICFLAEEFCYRKNAEGEICLKTSVTNSLRAIPFRDFLCINL